MLLLSDVQYVTVLCYVAKEVTFSSAFTVCLFVIRIVQNYLTDFHKIWWKGDTWAAEETIRFWRCSGSCNAGVRSRVKIVMVMLRD